MVWVLLWERGSRARVPVLLLAGVVATVALLPYLAELRGEASGTATVLASGAAAPADAGSVANDGAHLLRFGVRHIIPADSLLGIGWIARLAHAHPVAEDAAAGLLLLLPGYFVELGFYGLVLLAALVAMRRRRLDEAARTALLLACAGLAVATFLRSTVVENNDFAIRSILVAQFFLLLLAMLWWQGELGVGNRLLRGAMLAMAWIGLAGTLYQAVMLRVYLPVEERLGRAEVAGLAERGMVVRLGFDAMDRRVAKDAVVQYNTAQPGEFFVLIQAMMAGRQVALATPGCDAAFGGDPATCSGVQQGVARLFSLHSPLDLPPDLSQSVSSSGQGLQSSVPHVALSAPEARAECANLGVGDLVATRWDPVWFDLRGWVWTLPAVVESNELRVLDCAAPARLPTLLARP
jgi:hypothetical protein